MALAARYRGEFASQRGVAWKVEILQEGFTGTVKNITLPADSPLEIEWPKTSKLDPVQCSNATLKIISDTDREFIDLYSVAVGSVRLDVYREGSIYWSGCIDTELYSEPYMMEKNYEVTLTFSDLSVLDRLDWSGEGFSTISDIVSACLAKCKLNYTSIVKYISTATSAYSSPLTLTEVKVLADNFYDEEGEPYSEMEVLESVLRPFALRIIQKNGKVYIYDLNAISSHTPSTVEWDGDYSELSVDKVYNNVRLTFSPYSDSEMMTGKVQEDKSLTADAGGSLIKRDYERNSYGFLAALDGFRFHHNTTLESNMEVENGAHFFQICPIYSGSAENGVAESFKRGDYPVSIEGAVNPQVTQQLITPVDCGTTVGSGVGIFKCPKTYLGYTSFRNRDYKLRIALDVLFDVRYNPFEDPSDNNDNAQYTEGALHIVKRNGPYQNMQDWCNYGYIPIKLSIVNENGTELYHYENRNVVMSDGYDHASARWVAGAAQWNQAYLCYYDWSDLRSKTGFGGWKTNKQAIGYYRGEVPKQWQIIGDGEYIPLPPCGGFLVLEVGRGVYQFDYEREVKDIYGFNRWILFRNPSITLCGKNYKPTNTEDIEDFAWINRAAKEPLELTTIVGTCGQSHGVPNAKGQLFDSSGNIYSEFYRGGVSGRLERLLIGTAYSQYATRRDILSGEVKLLNTFGIYEDATNTGTFMLLSELQRVIEDVSKIDMADFGPDEYQGTES